MIDVKKIVIYQPVKNNMVDYEKIGKIMTGQGNGFLTGSLCNYSYCKERFNMIVVDLRKQQARNADPIQQINSTGNLDGAQNVRMFFIVEEVKETILDFLRGNVRVL